MLLQLYTNIPHEDGIAACKEAWDSRIIKNPPTETLIELLVLILKCNNFVFCDKHFLQVQGTAMGTKMAPSYANVFMGKLEGQLLAAVPLKPFSWLRYIDDIDMQWCHGEEALQDFLYRANTFHKSIKFTTEVSNEQHVFLDTVSHIKDNHIITDLYSKPTDKHQYLLPSSCHPRHCCKNIPYSLALRIKRICSNPSTFYIRAKELSEHLRKRGYKEEDIANAILNADSKHRKDLLEYKHQSSGSTQNKIPFVLTYHPDLPNTRAIIDKHWPIIESSQKLNKMFPTKPTIAYRRPKSLRDILVRAQLRPIMTDKEGQSGPCGTPRCQTCAVMLLTKTFSSKIGAKISLKDIMNCKTANVIYLISCKVCNKQYVGETKLPLNKRMNLHRSDWKTRKFNRSPVAEHFHLEGHSFKDVSLCCIEHNTKWSDITRKSRETYWIRRLNTLEPSGINKGD
ncbi:uncharacterized protein LOC132752158 [Ruditapes philippinarum]|uniref:uncharacterized protein LOC132752158 n=1 Tax=Ruditapes philippinarum TaxID=129788 RepID=UPI00295AEA61|nr:uncharacterized protein LOC132752158 [Ruditapes philippinarum]